MHRTWFGIVSTLLLCVTACGEEPSPAEPVVRPVKILELSGAGANETLEFPGTVAAGKTADLAFEVAGKLTELPAREGAAIDKDDLLARVDPRDYQAALDAERARSSTAKTELERSQALFDAGATSEQELDEKRRNFEVARSRIETASKAVADTRLVAPFAGVIARVSVENFENVQAKQKIILVQNDTVFEVVIAIPEQDAARIRPGSSLDDLTKRGRPSVEISSIPGRRFEARLSELATVADPATRTFAATFTFDNPGDVTIRSGMTAKLTIEVPEEVASSYGQIIPSGAAVADESGGFYVWVVDPQTMAVARRTIELGGLTGDSVQVRSGLVGTEWIAISGVHQLREGMTISPLGS